MSQTPVEEKAYAYVVRDGRLLVFDHPDPGNGVQVPKGGVEPGESPRDAVVRELAEESGLTDVAVRAHLATDEWPHPEKDKAYRRHFYHVALTDTEPDTVASASWDHEVTGDGADEGQVYAYYWVDPADVSLDRDMDAYVDRL